jgi:phosphonoacetate hydrolase
VIYLQDTLDGWLGLAKARVILPITDPYVVHHGALGSYALVYLPDSVDPQALGKRIAALPGIQKVLSRSEAAAQLELPQDRIGDLIIISLQDTTLGTSRSRHDLSGLDVPLRSHGGLSEQQVPLLANRVLKSAPGARRWRNFDAFDLGLNLVA